MSKIVFGGRDDRLGARLKNALAAHEYAKRIGAELVLAWNPVDHVDTAGIPFYDLFDRQTFDEAVKGVTIREESAPALSKKYRCALVKEFDGLSETEIAKASRNIFYDITAPRPKGQKSSQLMAEGFKKWPLNPRVKACVDHVTSAFDTCGLAVHVRRGDIMQGLLDPAKLYHGAGLAVNIAIPNFVSRFAPVQSYVDAITFIHPEGPVAVFSDDPDVRAELSSKIGSRSVRVDDMIASFNLTNAQTALAEFCIIASCKKALGGHSAFVEFAAELSGSEFHLIHSFIKPSQILPVIRHIVAETRIEDREALQNGLIEEYRGYFTRRGRQEDAELMLAS